MKPSATEVSLRPRRSDSRDGGSDGDGLRDGAFVEWVFVEPDHEESAKEHAISRGPRPANVVWLLVVAGILGFFLGMASGWQIAVESAQALAGVVEYPPENPFFLYHRKTWTLLHQIPTLLLSWGVSEQALSMAIGGLIGAISFQGVSLCTLAFSRDRWLAITTPLILLGTQACSESRGVYPVEILSDHPWLTYGVFGTSLTLLIWGLYAAGWLRTTGALMGLAPAFHPAMGAWCAAIGLPCLLWTRRKNRSELVAFGKWFAIGVLVTAVSLVIHRRSLEGMIGIEPDRAAEYVRAFAENWDSHRGAFPLANTVVGLALALVILGGVWLTFFRHHLDVAAVRLLPVLIASALVSLILCALTRWESSLPTLLVMAMPGRYINLVGLAFPAVVIGLLARHRTLRYTTLVYGGTLIYAILRTRALDQTGFYVPPAARVLLVVWGLLLLLAPEWERKPTDDDLEEIDFERRTPPMSRRARPTKTRLALRVAAGVWLCALAWMWKDSDRELAILTVAATLVVVILLRYPFSLQQFLLGLLIHPFCVVLLTWFAFHFLLWPLLLGVLLGSCWWAVEKLLRSQGTRTPRPFRSPILAFSTLALVLGSLWWQARESHQALRDWRNEPALRAASQGEGLLLTSSNLRLIQLTARRPVLLNGFGLNQLPYVPESAPAMNEILRKVYGEDLFRPRSADWRRTGGMAPESGRELWESRSSDDWKKLAQEFSFTDILTHAGWKLDLPKLAESERYELYHIP